MLSFTNDKRIKKRNFVEIIKLTKFFHILSYAAILVENLNFPN
jgi:hypothetical protein